MLYSGLTLLIHVSESWIRFIAQDRTHHFMKSVVQAINTFATSTELRSSANNFRNPVVVYKMKNNT